MERIDMEKWIADWKADVKRMRAESAAAFDTLIGRIEERADRFIGNYAVRDGEVHAFVKAEFEKGDPKNDNVPKVWLYVFGTDDDPGMAVAVRTLDYVVVDGEAYDREKDDMDGSRFARILSKVLPEHAAPGAAEAGTEVEPEPEADKENPEVGDAG